MKLSSWVAIAARCYEVLDILAGLVRRERPADDRRVVLDMSARTPGPSARRVTGGPG